jgi:predicted outer membrane repeat protein
MKKRAKILAMLFVALVIISNAQGETIYVDDNATGANDGTSWVDAYNYLQDALTAAQYGDEIWVAQGIYTSDHGGGNTPGDRTATLQLINVVAIKGGYAGFGEPDPDVRDITAYETTLSGDVGIVGKGTDNSYHVITGSGTDTTAVLDGFIITGGNANGSYPDYMGGGMYSNSGNPTLINCTFINNSARDYGGGMYSWGGSPILTNCTFTRNSSDILGGGIYYGDATSATLTNCTFSGNSADYGGGGIYTPSGIKMTNCILWANWSRGGMYERAQVVSWSLRSSVNYCCIQGLTGNFGGVGNTGSDPMFVGEPSSGPDGVWGTVDDDFIDLHLSCVSPCLDAGTNVTTPPLPSTDPDGNPRIVNGTVDMGAYEGSNQAFVIGSAPALVPEGGTAVFTVALSCEPSDSIDVTVTNHSGDTDISIESGGLLRFDSTNFSEPQIVVVAAAEDSDRLEGAARLGINAADVSYTEVVAWEVENDVGDVVFVDINATGTNDGTSWRDAFNHMQDAITFVYRVRWAVDEIRAGQGIYKPDHGAGISLGDREAAFQLVSDVAIKGGYAGVGEPDPNARDIELYETILSGDLSGDDVDVAELRDLLDDPRRAENSYHVVMGRRTDATAVLDGFTIISGNANGPQHPEILMLGGGMYNNRGKPTVRNCTFKDNSAVKGGGLYNVDSSPAMSKCTFTRNYARWDGGGMFNSGSNPSLINCTFSKNVSGEGGGMFNIASSPILTNCTFRNNSGYEGGGISNFDSSPMVMNCMFGGNSAVWGGGIYNYESDLMMTNCIVSGNKARWSGGGMDIWVGMPSPPGPCFMNRTCNITLTNCTFAENQSMSGRALACGSCDGLFPSKVQIANCILWDGGDEIRNYDGSTINVYYSDVWDGFLGEGNIDSDPLFVDPGYWALRDDPNNVVEPNDPNAIWIDGDYHLLAGSPCIDTGDPNYVPEPNETDMDGRPRVIGGRIDIGAYEYMHSIPAEVRIIPRTINLVSKGKWITCYIRLPESYNVAGIEYNSVFLEQHIKSEQLSVDEQKQVAIARFSREGLRVIINTGEVELTITGRLNDGTIFEATDIIRVIDKGEKRN